MALNPLRTALGPLAERADEAGSAFRPEAEAALARFRARRDELQRGVRRGELTSKVARRLASEAATEARQALAGLAEGFSTAPRAFLDRLAAASSDREKARASASLEALQRETNRLLRASLVEQQLRNREEEFRGLAFSRAVPGGPSTPTLDGLIRFHDLATMAGDEAAREWARRQLEAVRDRAPDPEDQRRIDLACDRPDRVNERLVARYVDQLEGGSSDELESFAREAVEAGDANACVAAFVLAREAPEGAALSWVRRVLDGVDRFPDAAIATLRAWEAENRQQEAGAALAEVDRVAAIVESEAALPALKVPSDLELDRSARVEGMPPASPGEPIGLVPVRRGLLPDEFAALDAAPADPEGPGPDDVVA